MRTSDAIEHIKRHQVNNFSGHLNYQTRENQHLGRFSFSNGKIVNCEFKNLTGKKAFYRLFVDMGFFSERIFVAEPESINSFLTDHSLALKPLLDELNNIFEATKKDIKARPPGDLFIELKIGIIDEIPLGKNEFTLSKDIVRFQQVEKIYQQSELLPFEVTKALVSLRGKKIIKTKKIMN